MGAGASIGQATVCRDPQAWLCRELRIADEISGTLAGGARCCEEGFTTKRSNPPRRGAPYFTARSDDADEQAETQVEKQTERDGGDSEAPLSGLRHDASLGAELSQHPLWWQGLQFETLGQEGGVYWARRDRRICLAIEEGLDGDRK